MSDRIDRSAWLLSVALTLLLWRHYRRFVDDLRVADEELRAGRTLTLDNWRELGK